jgi:hypothetical protein
MRRISTSSRGESTISMTPAVDLFDERALAAELRQVSRPPVSGGAAFD